MSIDIVRSLIYNTTLLISLSLIYSLVSSSKYLNNRYNKIIGGLLISLIGIAVMLTPWHFLPGIIFDVRSILLSVTGLFFGPIPTIIASFATGIFRIYQGGDGTLMGVSVIIITSCIGLLWRHFRPNLYKNIRLIEVYLFGVTVHIATIACMFLLPYPQSIKAFHTLAPSIIIIYPLGTIILCILLSNEYNRKRIEQELAREHQHLLVTLRSIGDGMIATDNKGVITLINQVAEDLTGWPQKEAEGRNVEEVFVIINEQTRETVENPITKVLASGHIEGLANHTILIARNGTEYAIADSGAPIYNANGNIIGVVLIFRDQTAERKTQIALKESEAHYHTLADSGRALVWTSGLDMKCDTFNKPWLEFTGRTFEQEYGDGWVQGVHPDDLERCLNIYTNAFTRREQFSMIYRLRRHDGEYPWILDEGSPRYNSQGEFIGYIGHCLDITERIQAEEIMHQLLERFDIAARAANLGVWDWDMSQNKLIWDDKMYEIYGRSKEDYPNSYSVWMNSRYPDDTVIVDDILKQALDNENTYVNEYRILWPDDSIRYLKSYGHLINDTAGKPIRMIGVTFDITDQKASEKALQESEERNRTIVKTAMDGLWVADTQGHLLEVNESLCKMTGYSEQELLTMRISDLEVMETNDDVIDHIHTIMSVGEDSFESKFYHKNRSIIDVEINAQYQTVDGGRIITFAHDITKRKLADIALNSAKAKLELALLSARMGVWEYDPIKQLRTFDNQVCLMLGLDSSTFKGTADEFYGAIHPDDVEMLKSAIDKTFENDAPYEPEYRVVWPDGSIHYILARGRLLRDDNGNPKIMNGIVWDISDQREAELNYRMLFQEMPDGIALHEIICNDNGEPIDYRFMSVNPAFEHMTGLKAELVQGHTLLEIFPKTEKHWIKAYGNVALTGDPIFFEDFSTELNKYFEVSAFSPMPNQFVSIFTDITERKQVEEALRYSESQYRSYVNNAPYGIMIADKEGRYVDANPEACETSGYTIDELKQLSIPDLIAPYARHTVLKAFMTLQQQGEVVVELPYNRKDGSLHWWRVSAVKLTDDRYLGFTLDITDQKQAEEALRMNEARLAKAQQVAHVGSWELDIKTLQFTWSDETIRIFGYEPGSFKPTLDIFFQSVHPDDRQLLEESAQASWFGNKPFVGEHRIITPDGSERIIHEQAEIIVDEDGQPIYMSGVVQDVTERKHLERQLLQAARMESIGRLAGGIAHDFNNILTGISGLTDIVLKDIPVGSMIHDDLTEVLGLTDRAASLTRQLLAFSRLQSFEPVPSDLNLLITNTLKLLNRLIGEDIELIVNLADDLGPANIDPSRIEQVLMNLAVNARDAMPNGGRLTISTSNTELDDDYAEAHVGVKPGQYIQLMVTDNGSGIDVETQQHIFEPFFTTKEIGKGTGLGLATVYGIIKQHGGSIWVYSEQGFGTTFKVFLPRTDTNAEVHEHLYQKNVLNAADETILLVEDELSVRVIAERILKASGYNVLTAANPAEAEIIMAQNGNEIQLLLTDVVMPGINGLELYQRLKIQYPDIKAVFISGYTDLSALNINVDADKIILIQKPFAADLLIHTIQQAFDLK